MKNKILLTALSVASICFASQALAGGHASKEAKRAPTTPPVKVVPGQIKLADLTILSATRKGGTKNEYGVQIKNKGTADSKEAQLFGKVGGNAVNAAETIPPIKAGQQTFVFIKFDGLTIDRGSRILFEADGLNQVLESNEKNNKMGVNFK